jgi:hypothetical protein
MFQAKDKFQYPVYCTDWVDLTTAWYSICPLLPQRTVIQLRRSTLDIGTSFNTYVASLESDTTPDLGDLIGKNRLETLKIITCDICLAAVHHVEVRTVLEPNLVSSLAKLIGLLDRIKVQDFGMWMMRRERYE